MIVAGDIGGTKTVVAKVAPGGEVGPETVFQCAKYDSLESILEEYLDGAQPTAACFGVAGPVVDGVAKITNLPWTISEGIVSQKLGGARVSLINDLQATALGHLEVNQFAILQDAPVPARATIGVLAPGTGLGEAILVWDESPPENYIAMPCEAGHADFGPNTEEELELWRFLHRKYGHVSNERILSGAGIGNLYDFVRGSSPELSYEGDRNAAISQAALAKSDPNAVRALDMFAEILGAEAGNHALRTLATGGISIGGGIPPKLLPILQDGKLVERFRAKGRFSTWMANLRVRVCLEPRAALFGAARYARTHR